MRQELNFIHNVKKEMLILIDSGWWEHKVCYIYEYFLHFQNFVFFLQVLLRYNFLNYIFIYFFSVVLSLHCCAPAFSSWDQWGLCLVVVHGLLIAVASLVAELRL